MLNKLRSKKGFTLVEILVVILIIGILFVAFLPRIDFAGDKARETNVKTDIRTFMVAAEQLFKENSGLPDRARVAATTDDGIETFAGKNVTQINKLLDPTLQLAAPTTEAHATGGVVSALKDPWSEKYRVDFYSIYPESNKQAIIISSHGKDFQGTTKTADYGAIIIYEKGHVSSCTFGLNQNIGTAVTGGTLAAGAYSGGTEIDTAFDIPVASNTFLTGLYCK